MEDTIRTLREAEAQGITPHLQPKPDKPTIGRIVHFIWYNKDATGQYPVLPMIITKVYESNQLMIDGVVFLSKVQGTEHAPCRLESGITYGKQYGHWYWPVREVPQVIPHLPETHIDT